MLVASRKVSLGDRVLEAGDAISVDLQQSLPRGRVEVLKRLGVVEELSDEARIADMLNELSKRVTELERQIGLRPRRGRPPKKEKVAA